MAYADRIVTLVGANTLDDVAAEWLAKGFPANPGSAREEDRLGGYANTPPITNTDTGSQYVVVRVPKELGLRITMAVFTTCQVEDTFPPFTVTTPEGDYTVNMPGIVGGDWSPAELPTDTADALAKAEIDAAAGAVDAKYTTVTGNQAMVYAAKWLELRDWAAATTPTLDDLEADATTYVYAGLRAEREAMKVAAPATTDAETIVKVQTELNLWKQLLGARETFRRSGKENVTLGATSTAKATAMATAKAQLAAI